MYKNKKKMIPKFIALSILIFPIFLMSNDWPFWRGPNRNGTSDETGWNPKALKDGAKILWEINVGEGYSSISIKDGYFYTMANIDNKDIIYCFDVGSGKEVWRFTYNCPTRLYPGSFSTPVVDDGHVFTFSRRGDIYCLDAKSGRQIWFINIVDENGVKIPKYGFSGSPVIEGNKVILNACLYGIALDKRSGQIIWQSPPERCGYATPVIYSYQGRKCAAIFSHRRLNGVDLETGELLWHFPWVFNDGADSPDPVVVGNKVFISTAYRNGGTMIEFNGSNTTQHWFKKEIQNEFGSSIYLNGYLFVPDGDTRHRTAYLKCIDFKTGDEVWCRDTGHCSIIFVDGKFVLLNQWGELLIMEASEKGYKDLSKAKVVKTSGNARCWTAPVLSHGRIFVRTSAGDIVCVDVS